MPELAEVQTLSEQLNHLVLDKQIAALEVLHAPLLKYGDPDGVVGCQIKGVDRWGKRLRFRLQGPDGEMWLVSSLGMTGGWFTSQPQDHCIATLDFDDGSSVFYVDPRRFGHLHLFVSEDEAQGVLGSRIGLDAGENLTDDQIKQALGRGRIAFKAALLDQSRLAGIGNYLADEIAWHAEISPLRPVCDVSDREWTRVNAARDLVIKRALAAQGLSFSDYRHLDGGLGDMQSQLRAYGRAGLPCLRCGQTMHKSTVAGRGTHWCPVCQD